MMIKKSIAVPSNRNYIDSLKSLDSYREYCVATQTELCISDNSGDHLKVFPSINSVPPCPMIENFWNALKATTRDFILLGQDDDLILDLFDTDMQVSPDIVGIQPTIHAFAGGIGLCSVYTMPLMQETAQERVIAYQDSCKGSNLGLSTYWRRDVLESVLHLWCEVHPIKGAYNDWAVVYALVSSGKVVRDAGTMFYKNVSNWTVDATEETKKLYRACGYEELAPYNQILNAIDGFIMTMRQDSPIPRDERIKASLTCLCPYTFSQVEEVLNKFDLLDKYREFYLYAIGKEWGNF